LELEKAATPLTPGTAAAAFVVYTFVATCASALAQVPALLAGRKTDLKELGARRAAPVPRVPPVPAGVAPGPDSGACWSTRTSGVGRWARCAATGGVLANTFESLERGVVQALRDPWCVPGRALPPVYCVGPLLSSEDGSAERHGTGAWRGSTRGRSAASCSKGAHSAEQLREIAVGLDKSGHPFLWLWVIRAPDSNQVAAHLLALPPQI
jgi:hypothetical protein